MLTYPQVFPNDIFAFTTLKEMDFFLYPEQNDLTDDQKDFLAAKMGQPLPPIANIRQVHGKTVIKADQDYVNQGIAQEADALITNVPELPIMIRTADCVPVFLYDPVQVAIGIVHAGWKSTKLNIVQETIDQMQNAWGTKGENILSALGPSILSCCYEVDQEFNQHFPGFVANIEGKYILDLPAVNKKQLLNTGVQERNIYDAKECTFCTDKYFSFRRGDEKQGRMASVMMIKGK